MDSPLRDMHLKHKFKVTESSSNDIEEVKKILDTKKIENKKTQEEHRHRIDLHPHAQGWVECVDCHERFIVTLE